MPPKSQPLFAGASLVGATFAKKLDDPALTHVISGKGKVDACITANEGRAANGGEPTWILGLDWVTDSVEKGVKQPEDQYDSSVEGADEEMKVEEKAEEKVEKKVAKGKGKRAREPSEDAVASPVAAVPIPSPPVAKIVKVSQKGKCPVDHRFPYASSTHVHADSSGIFYDCMLNKTQVGKNANKYYIIQILKVDAGNTFYAFNVWGRVGENGQSKVFGPYNAEQPAIKEFEKKFKDKTKLTWANRTGPPSVDKYTYLERSHEEDDEEPEVGPSTARSPNKKAMTDDKAAAESKIHPELQSLMKFIFNVSTLNQTMSSFEYDSRKLPLGKLAKSTIEQGFSMLKDLAALLQDPSLANEHGGSLQQAVTTLTNRYYTVIPHAFGRHVPLLINDAHILKRELDLVEALGDVKITAELMNKGSVDEEGESLHPLDAQLRGLGLEKLDPIEKTTSEFEMLKKLLLNSKGRFLSLVVGATHDSGDLELLDGFKVARKADEEGFKSGGFEQTLGGQRRLLWNGSRSSNYGGILSQGLRIAPPEAPAPGYLFGKGVYLASYEAAELSKKAGMLSTWGIGRTQPASWVDASVLSPELAGVRMPTPDEGPEEVNQKSALLYDEFIEYSQKQVKIRYLLRVKFKSAGSAPPPSPGQPGLPPLTPSTLQTPSTMAFLGMRSWGTPFLRPMWPFMVGGAITFYGVAFAQKSMLASPTYANDPKNPFKGTAPAAH